MHGQEETQYYKNAPGTFWTVTLNVVENGNKWIIVTIFCVDFFWTIFLFYI